MSLKLKSLGLALVAALAMSAVGVFSASAETGGHFTSESEHTIIDVIGSSQPHDLDFIFAGHTLTCTNIADDGTVVAKTVTEATVIPTYKDCFTDTGFYISILGFSGDACAFVFTIRQVAVESNSNTAHLECKAGKQVTLLLTTEPQGKGLLLCTYTFEAQTPTKGGVAYKTIGKESSGHELTLNVVLEEIHYSTAGLCGSKSTVKDSSLIGGVTVQGTNTAGEQVGITATGS